MSFFIAGSELEDDNLTFAMKSLVAGSFCKDDTDYTVDIEDVVEDEEFNRRHKIRKAIVRKIKINGYKPNLHRSK